MIRISRIFAFIFLCVFFGETSLAKNPTQNKDKLFIEALSGQWAIDTQHANGSGRLVVLNLSNDFTYQREVIYYQKNDFENSTIEYGVWGVENLLFYTVVQGHLVDKKKRPIADEPYLNRDDYSILNLTEHMLLLQHSDSLDKEAFRSATNKEITIRKNNL